MADIWVNPYSGQSEESCSVSFAAQNQTAGSTDSKQTEAQYYKSKIMGEIGVLEGKLKNGLIPDGTKLLTYTDTASGGRGYWYVKNGNLWKRVYDKSGKKVLEKQSDFDNVQTILNGSIYKVAIPQAVAKKPKPEPVVLTKLDLASLGGSAHPDGKILAVNAAGDTIRYQSDTDTFVKFDNEGVEQGQAYTVGGLAGEEVWYKPDGKETTPAATPAKAEAASAPVKMVEKNGKTVPAETPPATAPTAAPLTPKDFTAAKKAGQDAIVEGRDNIIGYSEDGRYRLLYTGFQFVLQKKSNTTGWEEVNGTNSVIVLTGLLQDKGIKIFKDPPNPPPAPPTAQVAAPVATPPVNPASSSVGSMSNEDVSAMFVKIKDDLAKEKGVNVKGASPELDQLVYAAIGGKTGYTAAEVQGKITAYKATGAKLSALKKKVMAGKYKIPEGKPVSNPPQQTKASPAAPLNTPKATSKPVHDPKPNGVPTTATPKLADEVKAEVKAKVEAEPNKVYSDEDVAAAYIIAKDHIVATNTKGWTLYTKNDEFDLEIAIQVGLKTGLNPLQQKQKIANYLASGKKLSVLKKQLVKQGAFKKQADTLKSKAEPADTAAKKADIDTKADAGYTPTPTPATGTPKMDTGKPAPKKVEKAYQQSGDISAIPDSVKALYYSKFKAQGAKSYLSSNEGQIYEALLEVQSQMRLFGHSKDVTVLQILRVIDEQGAIKFKAENAKLFEKKIVEWLTSPTGTAYVRKAEQAAAAKLEAAKAVKVLMDNQPPLPADSAQYQEWSLEKARRVSKEWLDQRPWTDKERRDLVHYTGSAYTEMNGYLRGIKSSIGARAKSAIEGAKQGMRPTTEPVLLKRGTGLSQFQTLGVGNRGDGDLVFGLTGKTFKDGGFLSTSAGERAAFGGEAVLEIECPVGTPMAYVSPISRFPHENEMLLQAGCEYKILQVRRVGGQLIVRMRVVNWPGKED